MTLTRRQLLNRSALAGAGVIATSTVLEALTSTGAAASTGGVEAVQTTSRLFPPLESAEGALLALPAGFTYELSKTFTFVAGVNALVGIPNPTVNFDLNFGVAAGI